jgi:divinyl chlorophyllide a 8-vinyl-reductase
MRGHYRTKTETNGLNHFLQTLMILALVMVVLMGQTLAFSPPGAYFLRSTSVTTTSCLFASAYVDDPVDDDAIGQELNKKKTVIVAGATGYIGRAVVQESVRRGYHTVALVRNSTKIEETLEGQHTYGMAFKGAAVHECDVEDRQKLLSVFKSCPSPIDSVISCLAAPSGTKKDVLAIDYQATLNCLETGQLVNARHFVLLSAFCCRNPLLQLQQAKLKCEAELANQTKMTWTSVRPTAFFKSVSGQLEAVKAGAPYVLFGDGAVTKCNPIAETELADFMMNCLTDESKRNRIVNVGGPDDPLTNRNLGEVSL